MFKLVKIFLGSMFLAVGAAFVWGSLIGWDNFEKQLKHGIRKVVGMVYYEATIHNPEGDMVPDEIDDRLKKQVKDVYRGIRKNKP